MGGFGHSFVKDNRATHSIVSHVRDVVILGPLHKEQQLGQVVGGLGGCLCRKAGWQVCISDMGDIVVYSQFSPASAARSITTLPGFILSIMYFLIRMVTVLPGMRLVVIAKSSVRSLPKAKAVSVAAALIL